MPTEERDRRLKRAKWAIWNCLQANRKGFVADLHNVDALIGAAYWLIQEPYNAVRPGTGLILRGPVGTGKTDLMRALSGAMSGVGGNGFAVVNIKRVVAEFARKGDRGTEGGTDAILRYAAMDHLCIDDVGLEDDGKHFGAVTNVLADLIALRYERWKNAGQITHITTNLDNAALLAKYDERTVSRIGEMCSELYLGGEDRRGSVEAPPSRILRTDLFADVPPMEEVSPERAAEHFAKINAAIKEVRLVMDAKPTTMKVVPATLEEDALEFGQRIVTMPDADLYALREKIERSDSYGSSKKFLELIDAEVKERNEIDQQAQAQ